MPRFMRVTFALMMREMATSYGRSALGYLWAVLEPIGAIALLSVAFSLVLRSPALGDNFPLFYATGLLPFQIYSQIQMTTQTVITQNRQLLFYPEVGYIDAIIARFLLVLLTQSVVAILLFYSIVTLFDLRVQIELPLIAASMGMAAFLGLGVGTINSVIIYLLPAWQQVWGVLNRPLFIASCVFFLFDSLPVWVQDILWYNPLVHIVGAMRVGFYSYYVGAYVSVLYPIALGAVSLLAGLILLRRYSRDMINF